MEMVQPDAVAVRTRTEQVKAYARSVGFDLVAVTTAAPFREAKVALLDRIGRGLMGGLAWFTRERAEIATDPSRHLPSAVSVISLGMSYLTGDPSADDGRLRGRVARYAWGRDYHDVVAEKLRLVVGFLNELGGGQHRVFVDHGRMVDRAAAQRAGLGWFGKNTNVLTRGYGSWVFLAEVVTDLPLGPDAPLGTNCGRCQACIPACPTGALVDAYTLDNTRCISYLTIELRGSIPRELRPLVGTWVFGCDICQDVCPVNRKAKAVDRTEYRADAGIGPSPELVPLLDLSEAEFRARFRGTPIWRAKRRGLLRNVAVALGNLTDPAAVPALARALADEDLLVRSHAAWALGRIGGPAAREALLAALARERDDAVGDEIRAGLDDLASTAARPRGQGQEGG